MLYSAESWDKVYNAFGEINFVAYDFASVKQSLIDDLNWIKANQTSLNDSFTEELPPYGRTLIFSERRQHRQAIESESLSPVTPRLH